MTERPDRCEMCRYFEPCATYIMQSLFFDGTCRIRSTQIASVVFPETDIGHTNVFMSPFPPRAKNDWCSEFSMSTPQPASDLVCSTETDLEIDHPEPLTDR